MIEYNTEQILRILKTEEFEIDELDLNKIMHVPMHQYRISSLEKPLLLIENLQVCIGLYAYGKNFGFAAHLNPVVMRGDEFECDINKNIVYCNRIDDLFNAIINSRVDKVNIGISIGVNPFYETYQQVDMLDKFIDDLALKLNSIGIIVNKLDLVNNHIFILDTVNQVIITPSVENVKEIIRRKKWKNFIIN